MRWGSPPPLRRHPAARYVPNTSRISLRGRSKTAAPQTETGVSTPANTAAPVPEVKPYKSVAAQDQQQHSHVSSRSDSKNESEADTSHCSSATSRREYVKPWRSNSRSLQPTSPRAWVLQRMRTLGPTSPRLSRSDVKAVSDNCEPDTRPPQFGLIEPSLGKQDVPLRHDALPIGSPKVAPKFQPSAKRRPRSTLNSRGHASKGSSLSISPQPDSPGEKGAQSPQNAGDTMQGTPSSTLSDLCEGIKRHASAPSLTLNQDGEPSETVIPPVSWQVVSSTMQRRPVGCEDIDTFSFADSDVTTERPILPDAGVQSFSSADHLPLETPREAARRRKRDAADREMARIAEVTAHHLAEQPVRPRPSIGSASDLLDSPTLQVAPNISTNVDAETLPRWMPVAVQPRTSHSAENFRVHSEDRSMKVACTSQPSFVGSAWKRPPLSPQPSSPVVPPSVAKPADQQALLAWGLEDLRETPRQAALRRKVEAADRDLVRLKAEQFEIKGDAGHIALQVRDAQARSFEAPFATLGPAIVGSMERRLSHDDQERQTHARRFEGPLDTMCVAQGGIMTRGSSDDEQASFDTMDTSKVGMERNFTNGLAIDFSSRGIAFEELPSHSILTPLQ